MARAQTITQVKKTGEFDLIIIGGGASGMGAALDASLKGLKVLLVEGSDFAKSTSSKSTKLIHGGVRYLAQLDIGLVKEALKEREVLLNIAPDLTHKQLFVIPTKTIFKKLYYFFGLWLYDRLSQNASLGKTKWLSSTQVSSFLGGLKHSQCKAGGVGYYDGQFDDSALIIRLAQHAEKNGGLVLNYTRATSIDFKDNKVSHVCLKDELTGESYRVKTKCILNATGIWADDFLTQNNINSKKTIRASKGSHVVINSAIKAALMVPKTQDGRVLFAIPWKKKTILGTTDIPVDKKELEPCITTNEIDFILSHYNEYFNQSISNKDILSVFSGLRPLVSPRRNKKTKKISRKHIIENHNNGIISVMGGKWTIFRIMAHQSIGEVEKYLKKTISKDLSKRYKLEELYPPKKNKTDNINNLVKYSYVQKTEDVLFRRLRTAFLDAKNAKKEASEITDILAKIFSWSETKKETELLEFNTLIKNYIA